MNIIIEIDCSMWIVNRNGDVCGIDEIELNSIFNCICFDMCLNSGYVDVYIENSIEIDLLIGFYRCENEINEVVILMNWYEYIGEVLCVWFC